jgi:hypothetical protein
MSVPRGDRERRVPSRQIESRTTRSKLPRPGSKVTPWHSTGLPVKRRRCRSAAERWYRATRGGNNGLAPRLVFADSCVNAAAVPASPCRALAAGASRRAIGCVRREPR